MLKSKDRVDQHHESFYTEIARKYHHLRYSGRYGNLFRKLHHEIFDEILSIVPPGRVLEVACGTGHMTELLKSKSLDYIACDLTADMLEQARERLGRTAPLVRTNALQLPFPDASFDVVLSTRFLHLFAPERQELILHEMLRVLKPGGRMIVDFDNFTSRWLLAVPHLIYNLIRYHRLAPEAFYNRIGPVEQLLRKLGLEQLLSQGVAGYHLILPAMFSRESALRLGRAHKHRPWRFLAEQFVTTGLKKA